MKRIIIFAILSFLGLPSMAQDLEDLLDKEMGPQTDYASATFKTTRVVNFHSIEQMKAGQLDFRINHRFGEVNSGSYEFWGLDQSTIKLSLEMGITDWLMLGIGRSSYQKTYDGFYKVMLFRQSSGAKFFPVTISYFSSIHYNSLKWDNTNQTNYLSSRFAYTHQLMIARKMNERISIQLAPMVMHRNLVETAVEPNNLWAATIGGRYKLTNRFAINVEYCYVVRPLDQRTEITYTNPLSFGVDIETGGHVFQLFVSNSIGNSESHLIGETTGKWSKGDLHFGFNISRVFSVYRNK